MIDISNLSDVNVEVGDVQNWTEPSAYGPPIPPGIYNFTVSELNEIREFTVDNQVHLEVSFNLKVFGGEHDGRALNFQRVNTLVSKWRPSSTALDFLMSAQVPAMDLQRLTPRRLAELCLKVLDQGKKIKAEVDWQVFSTAAYNHLLCEATGQNNEDLAKSLATSEQKKEAAKAATLYKTSSKIPKDSEGNPMSSVVCPVTQETVEARAFIRRFLRG